MRTPSTVTLTLGVATGSLWSESCGPRETRLEKCWHVRAYPLSFLRLLSVSSSDKPIRWCKASSPVALSLWMTSHMTVGHLTLFRPRKPPAGCGALMDKWGQLSRAESSGGIQPHLPSVESGTKNVYILNHYVCNAHPEYRCSFLALLPTGCLTLDEVPDPHVPQFPHL